jgi:hypothetical protein
LFNGAVEKTSASWHDFFAQFRLQFKASKLNNILCRPWHVVSDRNGGVLLTFRYTPLSFFVWNLPI